MQWRTLTPKTKDGCASKKLNAYRKGYGKKEIGAFVPNMSVS